MRWISSTENDRWSENNVLSDKNGIKLTIGEEIGSPLFGFGCCFNELGGKAISELSEADRSAAYDALFSDEGCGLNYCRLSIGANDFSETWYSYDETDGDYELVDFSIDRDRKYIIPAIKEAQKRQDDMEFFASPWSPPTWMKFPKVCNYGKLVQTEENLRAYARYLRRFVEEYKKEGINVRQICPQNEFSHDQKWPSCVYNEAEMENFVANYLIDEIGDLADIFIGTINVPKQELEFVFHNQYLNKIMQNPKCREHVKGATFQWGGKHAIQQAREDFPHLDLIHSECECAGGHNSWEDAIYLYSQMRHYFRHGARANTYWNIALVKGATSSWGWRQNSLISTDENGVIFNPEFYLIKHFSHFVKRGAVMLATKGEFSTNSAVFRNVDGSVVAVIMNPFEFERTVTIGENNYVLRPRSFNTIVL